MFVCVHAQSNTMTSLRISVLLILSLLALGQTQNMQSQTCTRGNSATIQPEATAWLGGIISLNSAGTGGFGCGKPQGSMQAYEAIRWVLDLLNKKDEYLQTELLTDYYVPGIRLGMTVRNYCSKEYSAVAAVADIYPELMNDDSACTDQTNNFTIGIVGPSSSGDSITLSDATEAYHIPLVSYESTATQLTMSGLYTNFMRTISPDGPLMEVIVQVLLKLKWKYIVVVYDSGTYGRTAYNELHAQLVSEDICLTAAIMVDAEDEASTDETLRKVIGANATGVIYFGPSGYARALVREGDSMLPDSGDLQWLFVDFPVDAGFEAGSKYQRGIISISAASRVMVEFEDHWIRIDENNPSPENPWFTDWYEDNFNCKFNPTGGETNCNSLYPGMTDTERELQKRAVFQQDQYVEAAVMAVFTYARALRNAQMKLCPGASGACQALRALSRENFYNDYVKKVDFTFTADERVPSLASRNVLPYNAAKHLSFTANGDIKDPSYYIWNYNDIEPGSGPDIFKFRRVGSYINNYLDLNLDNVGMYSVTRDLRIPLPPSNCPDQVCTPCLGLPADLKYYFEQGDVIINGIFSLHNMGVTPLTCGAKMSDNHFMYLEAMIYAVQSVNQDNSVLNNIRLGGLGVDDCSSSTLSMAFLSQIQRGSMIVEDKSGSKLDPRKIEAYTAAYNSPLTLPLAEAMNMLMRPMVGYRAGSSELDDKSRYPYYIRAIPGIYEEIRAIILLLKNLNWKFVQVVTSDKYYSQNAEEVFRDLGAKAGICIVATHNIGSTAADAERVVQGLEAYTTTQPTVVLLESMDIRRLLMAFLNNKLARARIRLIGTTMWGKNEMIVEGLEDMAEGVITLSLRHSTLATFQEYLRRLDVKTYTLNPWFREWYAAAHECSLDSLGSGGVCNTTMPITAGSNFRLMYEVESVINAVKAIARGLDSVLEEECGANYNTICSAFLTSQDRGAKFLAKIKEVAFPIEDMTAPNTFRFEDNSGAIPFEVQYYLTDKYEMVGTIETWNNMLELSVDVNPNGIMPTCAAPCLECLYMLNHLWYWYIPGDLVIGSVFDIHYKGTGPFSCGAVRHKNGALYPEVFNFALSRINSGTASVKLNGVTLGGLAFDGCSNPPRATAIVNRIHTGMEILAASGRQFSTNELIAWMTYDSETTIETASLVQKLNMPIVSPGATARELDDKSKYYTFFRTIPSDSVVVRGMAEFANEMGWGYVIVLNAPDEANRQARDHFRELLAGFGICIVANYEFETDGTVDVILDNIMDADTQVVAVFADPDRYVEDFLDAMSKRIGLSLTFIANRPWGKLFLNRASILKDSVFFELNRPTIGDFKTYLDNRQVLDSDNPWLRETYEAFYTCNLPGSFMYGRDCSANLGTSLITSNSQWEQDIWTLSTINAVYALAEGVHRTLVEKCGTNYMGICPDFMYDADVHMRIMSHMDAENFTDIAGILFDFIEREANRNYRLMRYEASSTLKQEGSLDRAGALTLSDKGSLLQLYAGVESACSGDCLMCSVSDANLQDFTLIEGDIYIVGLFDVHKQGGTPYTCGVINDKHGLPLLEAFNYAIEYVNNKTGIFKNVLPGVQIGGVGLDMCKSPARAANLVANIHSGTVGLSKNGITVNPRRIDAYVATMDTESSIRVADILTQLAMPQIAYGATGMDLLDMEKYKFFLRSVPADDKQARAMVSYLKKFQFNNVQVIGSFDEVGEPGMMEFKRLALVNKICITKEYQVGVNRPIEQDAPAVIQSIMNPNAQNAHANVVVLWMKNPLPLLEEASRNNFVSSNVLFIATDKWGADPDYLKLPSLDQLLSNRNLVILDVETADIPLFDEYLEYKTPDNYHRNPWFKDYFEMHQKCYWDTPSGAGTTACDKSSTIPRSDDYIQDEYVLYVVNAVFSAALGIHKALQKLCVLNNQNQYYGACNLYMTSGERRQNVMDGLRQVNFIDDTHQPFFFTEDGQSDRGFHIYNVTSKPFMYQNVGSYNDTHFLKLDITYASNYDARCNAPGYPDCICEFPPDQPSRFMINDDGDRGLTLVYVGDIHQADPNNPLECGPINTGVDLHKLLAFFYAIDRINSNTDQTLPDSLKFDGLALDSCTHSLRLGQDVYNVLSGNRLCDSDEPGLLVSPSSIAAFIVDKDHNALPVVDMLSRRGITSISPTAGSSLLDDNFHFPYFLRTRGDNRMTSQALLDVADAAGWDYLSVVYSDNLANQEATNTLLQSSQGAGACIADAIPLSMNATLDDAKLALERLSQQVGARAVALFVEPEHLKLLMEASKSLGLTGRFVWLTTQDWSQQNMVAGYEQEAAGSIMVEARSAILEDFTKYVMSLSYTNRRGIPDDWFQEIYQTLHQCNILNLENPSTTTRYSRICNLDEVITRDMVSQDPEVLHVIISVYAAALGLTNIPECEGNRKDIAACLQTLKQRNQQIYEGILGVTFDVLPELLGNQTFRFSFDENGNGQIGYVIRNYQANDQSSNASPNPYIPVQIGEYTSQGLSLNLNQYAGGNLYNKGTVPASSCAYGATCKCQLPAGQTWLYNAAQVTSDPSNIKVGHTYQDPVSGAPVRVTKIPGPGDRFSDIWAIILTVLACIGTCVSLAIFIYLLIMYPVRGGTSILGFILSFGIVLLYLMVFPFIAHADERICGLRRFGLGFVYAIVYSSLMVKLVDCWRVRGKDESKYSKLGRPFGLFMVTFFFVLVQVMINAEWLILRLPKMTRIFYHDQYWPRCTPEDFYDEGLVLSLVYIMAIIVFSLLLCFCTFTTTKNHRESRWILGILILSIPTWVIWCAVSILGEIKVRDAAVAVGLLVNATFMLLFVPVRKLYLLHKYHVLIEEEEEERRSNAPSSLRGTDYNSVYGRQYDNNPKLHDAGSTHGSTNEYSRANEGAVAY